MLLLNINSKHYSLDIIIKDLFRQKKNNSVLKNLVNASETCMIEGWSDCAKLKTEIHPNHDILSVQPSMVRSQPMSKTLNLG